MTTFDQRMVFSEYERLCLMFLDKGMQATRMDSTLPNAGEGRPREVCANFLDRNKGVGVQLRITNTRNICAKTAVVNINFNFRTKGSGYSKASSIFWSQHEPPIADEEIRNKLGQVYASADLAMQNIREMAKKPYPRLEFSDEFIRNNELVAKNECKIRWSKVLSAVTLNYETGVICTDTSLDDGSEPGFLLTGQLYDNKRFSLVTDGFEYTSISPVSEYNWQSRKRIKMLKKSPIDSLTYIDHQIIKRAVELFMK
jgi:hypothetical protein